MALKVIAIFFSYLKISTEALTMATTYISQPNKYNLKMTCENILNTAPKITNNKNDGGIKYLNLKDVCGNLVAKNPR